MRLQGRLTEWNDERGFGFVTSLDGSSRAFVHVSEFPHQSRRPVALDLLTYEIRCDERGRLQAAGVSFMAPVAPARGRANGSPPHFSVSDSREMPLAIPFGVLGALLLLGALVRAPLAAWILLGYVGVSLLTFVVYAVDKSAAQAGRFRTQESALHLLEIAGGWPGALLAQRVFRHKTRKRSYQVVFWAAVIVNLAALGLLVAMLSKAPV